MTQSSHELTEATHQLEALHKKHDFEKLTLQQKLEEEKNTLLAEKYSLEVSFKDLEEEKMVLTSQVKAYSHQYEELKKTMEEQFYHKERLESEVM